MTAQNNSNGIPDDEEMTFVTHLLELRDRLLRIVLAVVIIFLSLFYFANDIYTFVAGPLMAHLPEGSSMVAIEVASPFLTPFKLTLVLSIFAAVPFILYQMWQFVAPGLYQHERRLALPIVASSTVLFYLGMTFAYFVVFPLVFGFFTSVAPEGVAIMTDIGKYLDFVLTIFFAFGIAFEVPIATIILVWTGATTPAKLSKMRPYVIVGAFVIGMLLTPPDVISQTLLAIPMWVLYELGIIFSRFYVPKADSEEAQDDDESEADQAMAASASASAGTAATEFASANESGHGEYEPLPPSTESGASNATESTENSGHADYKPLSEQEMDDELDRIDAEMDELDKDIDNKKPEDKDKN